MAAIKVPLEIKTSEIIIKKSRFIATAYPILTDGEAKEIIRQNRKDHPGANHVCHALILGDAGTHYGMSDDREPSGTAGRPMLEVLKGSGITNLLVTVARYFGGTKLGTGGLVKAYTEATQAVLENLKTEEKIARSSFALHCPYTWFTPIRDILIKCNAEIQNEEFQTEVELNGVIPDSEIGKSSFEILELTNGQVHLKIQN